MTHRRISVAVAAGVGVVLLAGWLLVGGREAATTRILTARRILTMETDRPTATAVAVRDGRIVAVGSLAEVTSGLGDAPFQVDERFARHVLLPGFIDPHVHPVLAATILPMDIVSAMAWETPNGRTRAVRGRRAFLDRLRELEREKPADEWLLVWGYHRPYHGELSKADLDAISSTRPILVWQRSVHEMVLNSRALEEGGLTAEDFAASPQADWDTGRVWEAAMFSLGRPYTRRLASPSRYRRGLAMMSEVLHRGGLTTVGEQGFPQISRWAEWGMLQLEMATGAAPFRFVLVPNAMYWLRERGSAAEAERAAAGLLAWSTRRVRVAKHVKYYADGAIFSQLMQMSQPYLDGHHGEWMMPPEDQRAVLEAFWKGGWDVHVHVNGDAGLDLVLDQVEALRREDASSARRVILEHYGYARQDQHARLAALGVEVSNNAYYVHELAPIYADHGLGPERAADISPLGGLARAGVPFSFHSDFPMAPAEPLRLVWAAVNRLGSDGRVWGEDERVPLDLALRAVTVEAARSLGVEDEVGSIRVGKRADFSVLERDPHEVAPEDIAEIPIWGTVFEGIPRAID
ncbi:MAG: amidohydrolase [Myxococcota bacterium]